jgi:DNA-binding MarR family transcriptional regulator
VRDIQREADEVLAAAEDLAATQEAIRRSVELRSGLTPAELSVLITVFRADAPVTEQEIAAQRQLPVQAVRQLIASLETKRCVTSIHAIPDKRDTQLVSTVDTAVEPWSDLRRLEESIDEAIRERSPEEVETAVTVLHDLVDASQSDRRGGEDTKGQEGEQRREADSD